MTIHIESIGGECPVQAEGTIYRHPFYFRARGDQWSIGVGGDPVSSPIWDRREPWGLWPEAGYMPHDVVEDYIHESAAMFRRWLLGV